MLHVSHNEGMLHVSHNEGMLHVSHNEGMLHGFGNIKRHVMKGYNSLF